MPAKSPIAKSLDLVAVSILVGGKELKEEYQAISLSVSKTINKVPTAKIVLLDGNAADQTFEISESGALDPGKEIEIKAGYDTTVKTIFKGIITDHGISLGGARRSTLTIRAKDAAVKLTLGRKTLSFEEKKDSEILQTIAKPLVDSVKVEATKFKHPKVIQYDSTDWDFIMTRAEINGFVVISDDGALTIGPPVTSGTASFIVTQGVDILEFDANIDSKYQLPDKLVANSWDMKTQKLLTATAKKPSLNKWGDLDGGKLSDVIGLKELQTSSSAPIPKEVLQEWSNGRLLKSRLAAMHGKVTFHGNADVKVGTLLDIAGMGKHFNGTAYISGIDHQFQNGMWTTTARFGLDPKWFVETRPEVNTLNTAGLIPAIKGLQTGVVKQIEEDPDGEHRILVDIPVVEASGKGVWARLTHLYASKGIGFFFMPEVGDEVVLGFLNDDPRYPIIVGMMYSSKLAPAETATKDNFIKSITTKEKMKITFDEEKKIITIETPGKNTIVMDDDKKAITLTDANKNVVALDDKGISLTTKKDITIDAKGKVTLGGAGGVAIASKGGNVTMEGISVEAKAKMAFKAEGKMVDVKGTVQANLEGAIVTIN